MPIKHLLKLAMRQKLATGVLKNLPWLRRNFFKLLLIGFAGLILLVVLAVWLVVKVWDALPNIMAGVINHFQPVAEALGVNPPAAAGSAALVPDEVVMPEPVPTQDEPKFY